MAKRGEQEPKAIRLYAEGVDIPEISRVSREENWYVSENTLRKWKDDTRPGDGGPDEWDQARAAVRKSYVASFETVGARLRRSRDIANQITGSAKDQSAVGMMLNQSVQTMLYDLMERVDTTDIDADNMGVMSKLISNITLALGRTEQAASRNLKTAADIRKQAFEEAAKTATDVARQAGVSDETVDAIWRDVLRMK